jgi:hypothetical protein
MKWRIECKHSGTGEDCEGSFDEALAAAQANCQADWQKFVVWLLPANIRMAEVIETVPLWVKQRLTGDDVKTLIRRHKKTIAELAFLMGITQKRIRQVRDGAGLDNHYSVRDWIEAITSEDVGLLPERYRIRRYDEEAPCGDCGCPLMVGAHAFEYAGGIYCSVTCSRKSRMPAKEVAR